MPENLLQTLQTLIEDVIAPDVRELMVADSEKSDAQFRAVLIAIAQIKAGAVRASVRAVASLGESTAVLEAARH